MYAPTTQRRTLVATAVFAAAWFAVAVPASDAAPKPEPQNAVTGCPIDAQEFSAELRVRGFTAQAANNATQLTSRECFRELTPRSGLTVTKQHADQCAGLQSTLSNLESLTRTVDGHVYRRDGVYSAGSALLSELSARHCA